MIQFIIGAVLIVGGALIGVLVTRAIKNKNIEIKFMQTTSLSDLKKQLADSAGAGLTGYRQYVEIKGVADAETSEKTPYSEKEVAYFTADFYQVDEEAETYTDENGTHQRMKRKESLVSSQKSYAPLYVKDSQGEEKALIELAASGMQLDMGKTFDKFEPVNAMNQYGFFGALNLLQTGIKTVGYRMVEHSIALGQPLYVLGDAMLQDGRIAISKPADKKKPFIVSIKSEADLVRGNESKAVFSLVGGIAMGIAGILVILFVR
jgi:hypothetical protein